LGIRGGHWWLRGILGSIYELVVVVVVVRVEDVIWRFALNSQIAQECARGR
jgi:hypothetical protein